MDATSKIEKMTKDYIEKTQNIYEHFKDEKTDSLKEYQSCLRPKGFLQRLFFVFSDSKESLEYHTISKILEERKRK